jgi:phenylacetate-coenzyme A ligase PaaK-like adenylate-forming protein
MKEPIYWNPVLECLPHNRLLNLQFKKFKRIFRWAQEYRPEDRVFIPFGYNVFVAFWAGHYAAEKIGCEVVPGGVLDNLEACMSMRPFF